MVCGARRVVGAQCHGYAERVVHATYLWRWDQAAGLHWTERWPYGARAGGPDAEALWIDRMRDRRAKQRLSEHIC